uniref:Splicing factor U2AF subunit n=1 Tax=Moniliophthora roreri TaxID=221103 RepID=A0A0W0G9W3_MONRR
MPSIYRITKVEVTYSSFGLFLLLQTAPSAIVPRDMMKETEEIITTETANVETGPNGMVEEVTIVETGIEIETGIGGTETETAIVTMMTAHRVGHIMMMTGAENIEEVVMTRAEVNVADERKEEEEAAAVAVVAEAEKTDWRRRKASGWDVHAPGYEQYTAMQAKQTGLFNLPGANRTQIPPILGIPGLPPPMPVQTFGMGIGSNPNLSRQSRRLYIGSITPEVTEQNLAEFFNQKMAEMNIGTGAPGNPVLAVQCNYEKNYAFVEFRSAEDATSAMAFDGIIFINGPLKIRRPKDYGGDMVAQPNVHVPGVVSTNVPDSINKVFVGGLPTYLNEENVMELLKSFGELKAFNLVRENGNGPSKGFAFFEYVDPNVTDVAIQSLNGMELGDRYLVVQRASVGAKPGTPGMIPNPDIPYDEMPEIPRPIMPAGESAGDARILLMLNMVTPDDLVDDEEYGDLYEDVKEECSGFGKLEDLRIPRPIKKDKKWAPGDSGMDPQAAARADEAAGVGRVYVKYVDGESAAKALKSLAGRSFAGRSIVATLLSEDSQTTPPLNLIFAPQPEAPPPLPSS